jgi:hypothetical protein
MKKIRLSVYLDPEIIARLTELAPSHLSLPRTTPTSLKPRLRAGSIS